MKFIEPEQKGHDPVAVIDEYDLHNIFCSGVQLLLAECVVEDDPVTKAILEDYGDGCSGCISAVKVVPRNPDKFNISYVHRYEQLLTGLITQIRVLDGLIHEDAEYTC